MPELPKRKQLRLKDYDYSQNGYYFITICTHNRQHLFNVGNDLCVVPSNPLIQKWLFELQNKFDVCIDKYVIMPNHIHFILLIKERHAGRSLQKMMQWYKTMTTNVYIKLVKQGVLQPFNKQIWQKSYYEHIIRNEQEYLKIYEYIENNPLKWEEDKYYGKQ